MPVPSAVVLPLLTRPGRVAAYAMENLTDIGARVYIDGEMYRTVCSCRPSLPAVDVNCFPAKVRRGDAAPSERAAAPREAPLTGLAIVSG